MRSRLLLLAGILLAALVAVLLFWNPGPGSSTARKEAAADRAAPLPAPAPSKAGEAAVAPDSPPETRQTAPEAALARVRLIVRLSETGKPFTGARVWLLWKDSAGAERKETGRTDPRGVWEWEHPPGGHLLGARVAATAATAPATKPIQLPLAAGLDLEVKLWADPAGRIAGLVKDEQGRPVSGATVSGWNGRDSRGQGGRGAGDPAAETRTDAGGRYELGGFGMEFTVFAEAPGLVSDRRYTGGFAESRRFEGIDFILVPGYTLTGEVLGPDRRPVDDAAVHLVLPDAWGSRRATAIPGVFLNRDFRFETRTDADGRFTIGGLFARDWQIQVHSTVAPPWEGTLEPGQKEIRIVLEGGFALEGLVLDWLGGPAEGAEVRLQPQESSLPLVTRSTRTDARGRFRMTNLGTMARARLLVHAAGNAVAVLEKIVVKPGMPPLVVRLEKGLALAGQVQDARGEPVASVPVSIRGPRILDEFRIPVRTGESLFGLERVKTGEDGRFRFVDLYPGDFTVKAAPQGNRPGASTIAPAGTEGLVLVLGAESGGKAVFFGKVRNAETGAPLPGASISVMQVRRMDAHSWGARGVAMATSAKDGSFEAKPVEPGELYVWITAKGFSSWQNKRAEVEAGRHFIAADLHPARTLLVKVVDAGGNPVQRVSLEVLDPEGKQLSITVSQGGSTTQVQTDSEGIAGLAGLPAVPVTVRVTDLGLLLGRFDFDLTRPTEGTRELRLPISFEKPRRVFTIRIVEKTAAGATKPLETLCTVRAYDEEGRLVGQASSLPDRTDPGVEPSPSSEVSLSLPRKPCRLEITAEGFQPAEAFAEENYQVKDVTLSRR